MPTPTSGGGKKIFFIVGFVLLFVVGLLATVLLLSNRGKQTSNTTPSVTPPYSSSSNKPRPFPQVSVKTWEVDASSSAVFPKTASVYSLRKISTLSDATDLSKNFFESEAPTKTATSISFVSKPSGNDLLYVQTTTGSILMKSLNGIPLVASTSGGFAVSDLVNQFVQKISNADPTLATTATYSKKDSPGVIYYEVHRDWTRVGMPILNLLGVFNLKDKVALSSYTLASKPEGLLQNDPNIVETSDGRDGKARLRDFNTMTIGVKGSRIMSLTSNLRFLSTTTAPTSSNLISYSDAVTKLKTGGYSEIYTSPIGSGVLSPDKLYPNNTAKLSKVNVTDVAAAYLESLPQEDQLKLIPHYIFRGHGALDTGYEVDFLAAVPAVNTSATLGVSTHLLAQATGSGVASQKQGTLPTATPTPTKTPTPTLRPTTEPITEAPPPPTPPTCSPTADQLTNVHTTSGGLTYGQWAGNANSDRGTPLWYVVPTNNTVDISQIEELVNTVLNTLDSRPPGTAGSTQVRNGVTCYLYPNDDGTGYNCISWASYLNNIINDAQYAPTSQLSCPRPLSSLSPSVFIYSASNRLFSLKVNAPLKYTNTSSLEGVWNVNVTNNVLSINNNQLPYLYYEYEPKTFNIPTSGWTVDKSHIGTWVNARASELQLTSTEKERLTFEVTNAASQVVGDMLFLGLIPQSEVDTRLPLTLSENADVTRLHFYVTSTNKSSIAPAKLQPVRRSPFMLLEIGAVPVN